MKKSDDQKDMFRNQGAIAILEKLIGLPEIIREHQKARITPGPDGQTLQKKVEVKQ